MAVDSGRQVVRLGGGGGSSLMVTPVEPGSQGSFQDLSDSPDGPKPWSHLRFADDPEAFSFVIVADRTVTTWPGVFRSAMPKVILLMPQFAISDGADHAARQILVRSA